MNKKYNIRARQFLDFFFRSNVKSYYTKYNSMKIFLNKLNNTYLYWFINQQLVTMTTLVKSDTQKRWTDTRDSWAFEVLSIHNNIYFVKKSKTNKVYKKWKLIFVKKIW